MAAKLVNESKSEEIHNLFLKDRADTDEIFYRSKETFGYFKKNYVIFRELMFSQNLVVIKDGDNQLLVENMSKINPANTVLIVRHAVGSISFIKEALGILSKLFKGRHVSKAKILCFANEITKDVDNLTAAGFEKEIEYAIGENDRVCYSFKFKYD